MLAEEEHLADNKHFKSNTEGLNNPLFLCKLNKIIEFIILMSSSKEYNQLLQYLYFEGYADSYSEAEELLESMSSEEFEELLEAKDIPQEVALKIADMLKGAPALSRRGGMARSLRQYATERNKKRLEKLQQNEKFDAITEYLFVEGFADTIESAELMAESISQDWIDDILNEKTIKAAGQVADRRARTTDPTVRARRLKPMNPEVKYSESGFDSTASRRSPGARRRRAERRQGTGGFNA